MTQQTGPATASVRAYPWLIVTIAMLTMTMSNGLIQGALSIYDPSLLDHFHWGRGELKMRDLMSFWPSALLAPVCGPLIDRFNPKYLLMLGLGFLSLGLFGYSTLTEGAASPVIHLIALVATLAYVGLAVFTLRQLAPRLPLAAAVAGPALFGALADWGYLAAWAPHAIKQVYVIHLLLALALAFAGGGLVVLLVSAWFVRFRGLAIGMAVAGTSLGGAVLPPINAALIGGMDWRQAIQVDAAMPLALMLVVLIVVRGLPRHAGVTAVGQNAELGDLKEHGLRFGEAIRTKTYWAIAISGFLTFYAIFSIVQHLVLYMTRSLGYTLPSAANVLLIFSIIAFASKLLSGALADRIDRHLVFMVCLGIMLIGVMGLATMHAEMLLPSVAAIGLGWGSLFTLYNMLAVNSFGLREIGRINGGITLFESLGIGLGSWVTGWMYDRFGDYHWAFVSIACMVALGLLIGSQTRRSPLPEVAVSV